MLVLFAVYSFCFLDYSESRMLLGVELPLVGLINIAGHATPTKELHWLFSVSVGIIMCKIVSFFIFYFLDSNLLVSMLNVELESLLPHFHFPNLSPSKLKAQILKNKIRGNFDFSDSIGSTQF